MLRDASSVGNGRLLMLLSMRSEIETGTTTSILTPHLLGHLHDHAQLSTPPLPGEQVPLPGGTKPALRRERGLVDADVFRRLVDPALERVAAFELAALGGDEAEHDGLALRHEPQRLKPARPFGVV